MSGQTYQAYGLTIESAFPLPELEPASPPLDVDLAIHAGPVPRPELDERLFRLTWTTGAEACLVFRDAGAFLIRNGREIIADPAPGLADEVLRQYLLGPALAVALHQRGWLILHASAVAIDGRAVAFLGGSGWGKSTLAASLHQRGHALIADDFIAVPAGSVEHLQLSIFPGFPQFKLWPEAASALGADPDQLPRLDPDLDKRAQRLTGGFAPAPLPLGRLYVLAEGEPAGIERLDKPAALVELLRHSYISKNLPPNGAAAQLRQCAAVLGQVGVSRLRRPLSLPALSAVAQMVEADQLPDHL